MPNRVDEYTACGRRKGEGGGGGGGGRGYREIVEQAQGDSILLLLDGVPGPASTRNKICVSQATVAVTKYSASHYQLPPWPSQESQHRGLTCRRAVAETPSKSPETPCVRRICAVTSMAPGLATTTGCAAATPAAENEEWPRNAPPAPQPPLPAALHSPWNVQTPLGGAAKAGLGASSGPLGRELRPGGSWQWQWSDAPRRGGRQLAGQGVGTRRWRPLQGAAVDSHSQERRYRHRNEDEARA